MYRMRTASVRGHRWCTLTMSLVTRSSKEEVSSLSLEEQDVGERRTIWETESYLLEAQVRAIKRTLHQTVCICF